MADVATLKALLAKVETGKMLTAQDECLGLKWDDRANFLKAANSKSLDAAMALHNALLPGWRVEEIHHKYAHEGMGPWHASLERRSDLAATGAISNTPARAWLIAILKALIAEAEA